MHTRKKAEITLTLIFIFLTLVVYGTFTYIHQSISAISYYGVFSLLLIHLNSHRTTKYKKSQLVISLVMIIAGGFLFPADIEQIEEMYLIIPLLYLFILPGTFWPIVIAFLLISAYIPSFEKTEFWDFIEDSMELFAITSFATIMTYFQQKSFRQMKHYEKESNTDFLTRLPNRKQFVTDMEELKCQCKYKNIDQFSLVMIDLDGFKKVNDQFGHKHGDELLILVAKRLIGLEHTKAKPYRLGGDEFAFLIEETQGLEVTRKLTQDIIDFFKDPYVIDIPHFISSSIGVAVFPDDAKDIDTLYRNADLAMYNSKNSGKNGVFFYDNTIMEKTIRKYEIEDGLKFAIEREEMSIYYQPKVFLENNDVHSAEALLRWNHPKLGAIAPNEFIPIAEESDLIIPLGEWVLENVCKQIVQWQENSYVRSVAVNVSPVQLADPDFIEVIATILQKTGCRGEWLEIEQTESWVMENPDKNVDILNRLKSLGVTLSLDDFGTAYSSLSQIRRLPMDSIKIDKSFIDHCVHNRQDHMLVRTIIQLGHNLGMSIIAEGVETNDQRELLNYEKCDYYQGFYYSEAITPTKIESIFKEIALKSDTYSEEFEAESLDDVAV